MKIRSMGSEIQLKNKNTFSFLTDRYVLSMNLSITFFFRKQDVYDVCIGNKNTVQNIFVIIICFYFCRVCNMP